MNSFLNPSPKTEEPKFFDIPTQDEFRELIMYFRDKHHADKHNGYNLCRKINEGIIKYLKENYPNIQTLFFIVPIF